MELDPPDIRPEPDPPPDIQIQYARAIDEAVNRYMSQDEFHSSLDLPQSPYVGSYVTVGSTALSNSSKLLGPSMKKTAGKTDKIKTITKNKSRISNSNMQKALSISNLSDIASVAPPSGGKIPNDSLPLQITSSQHSQSTSPVRSNYSLNDSGPFVVYVELVEPYPTAGATLHPIKFGAFLFKYKFTSVLQDGIKKIGRNRLTVSFRTAQDANDFINNDLFAKNNFKVYIPVHNISRLGIVKGIPTEWSHEEIIDSARLPYGTGAIIKTRRISRKVSSPDGSSWVPTQSVVLTFDGQILPKELICCFTRLPVEQYVYPTIQCYNCCRFGHTRSHCRSKPRCFKCSQEHSPDTCQINISESTCIFCSGHHYATFRSCPEHVRQTNIKHHMANHNVSYQEAMTNFPQSKKSFAEVLSSSHVVSTQQPLTSPGFSSSQTPSNLSSSYKKTVTLKPHLRPALSQGYDENGHLNLLKSFEIPSPANGCAIRDKHKINVASSERISSVESLSSGVIQNLLSSLIKVIANSALPNNVAYSIIQTISFSLFNLLKNGSCPSVE